MQNSLNFQEEIDKESIALYASNEIDKGHNTAVGSALDEHANKFMKGEPPAFMSAKTLVNSNVAAGTKKSEHNLLAPSQVFQQNVKQGSDGKTLQKTEKALMAHLDVDKRCQMCAIDNTQRHILQRAFKVACLNYRSGPVKHDGQ